MTTRYSGKESIRPASPVRKRPWSSTRATVVGCCIWGTKGDRKKGSFPGGAGNVYYSRDHFGSLIHIADSETVPASCRRGGIEAFAIISYRDPAFAPLLLDPAIDLCRIRMFDD